MTMKLIVTAVCLSALASGPSLAADGPQSPDLAKRLVSAMTARQLDAIAAADPAEPGRYIAALAFPGVQLLVVSAPHPAAEYLKLQLTKRQFREVYGLLQNGVNVERFFFHDMGCDGLQPAADIVDVLYEGTKHTRFDGKWDVQSMSAEAYAQKVRQTDEQYARALTVLLEAVNRLPVPTAPN